MRKVQRYAFKVFYDGAKPFYGFQRQPGIRTVEGELIRALVKSRQVSSDLSIAGFLSAGRTDRFVSALGNVLAVNAEGELRPAVINSKLGEDIRVWARAKVPPSFNPRREALRRHYKYFARVDEHMDLDLMIEASKQFAGIHDFRNFAHRPSGSSSVREILDLSFTRLGDDFISINVVGDSFLHRMVRRIVGALFSVASGSLTSANVGRLLDPSSPLPKGGILSAPPEGLVLWDIEYSFPFEVDRYAVEKLQRSLVRSLTILEAKKAMLQQCRTLSEDRRSRMEPSSSALTDD
jgi:tRNA pseudouridine38-40 synthase